MKGGQQQTGDYNGFWKDSRGTEVCASYREQGNGCTTQNLACSLVGLSNGKEKMIGSQRKNDDSVLLVGKGPRRLQNNRVEVPPKQSMFRREDAVAEEKGRSEEK